MVLTKTHLSRKVISERKKNACGKPETPQVGLGVTNAYKNAIGINKYLISYRIGIKKGPIYGIILPWLSIPSWAGAGAGIDSPRPGIDSQGNIIALYGRIS